MIDCNAILRNYSRYLLIIFNFFFVLTGVIIISVGISAKAYFNEFDELLNDKFFYISDLMIVIGVIIFMIAFFGCCGAIKENACMTTTFSSLLVVIFILEALAGIGGIVLKGKTEGFIQKSLTETLVRYNGTNETELTITWDTVQKQARKKKSREEILKIKREREKKRRQKIRDDPEKREIQRQKEREKYLKQKEKRIKKSIKEMTEREQRSQRKKWNKASKDYYKRKKQNDENKRQNLERVLNHTPPLSDLEEPEQVSLRSIRHVVGQRLSARNRVKRHREFLRRNMQLRQLRTKLHFYKSKYYRLKNMQEDSKSIKNKTNSDESPGTKVQNILDESLDRTDLKKVQEVKRNLLFGEVVKKQLKETYNTLKTNRSRQVFQKLVHGKVVKKYRMKTKLMTSFGFRSRNELRDNEISRYDRHFSSRQKLFEFLKRKVHDFFELENVSRVCPGRKEYVTNKKVQKQKRYLSDTLRNLYLQFLKKYPTYQIGYSFFCKHRPFWVKIMKVAERDTCKCIQCANMELIVKSLNVHKVLLAKSPSDVINDICCNSHFEGCLLRNCQNCISSEPQKNDEFLKTDLIQYYQWVSLRSKFYDKKTRTHKQTTKIVKQPYQIKVDELLKIFDKKILLWMAHQARILHQHTTMTNLKENLKESEILVHCDFSENYMTKYSEETQSFHFGGSRKQISIHTVVIYSKVTVKTVVKSYCTLSDSLNHGPAAIWAHLTPILNEYLKDGTVTMVNFLSDSPATQYRNKHMFSYLTNQLFKTYPQLQIAVWNYHESGHGKGAPDGLGGLTKRKADEAVSHGKDVADLETFYEVVKEKCPGVQFYVILPEQIEKHEHILGSIPVKLFKGTMKVHQVVAYPLTKKLWIRSLSCYACVEVCSHYELGTLEYKTFGQNLAAPKSFSSESSYDSEDNLPLSCFNAKPLKCITNINNKKNKLNIDDVYSDEDMPSTSNPKSSQVKTGTYVLVSIPSLKNITYRYVAVCTSNLEDEEVKLSFLKLCHGENNLLFKLDSEDSSYIKEEQILEILPEPTLVLKGNRIYYKFKTDINVFESA